MRHAFRTSAIAGLLLLAGCDRSFTQARKTVYVPHETGLTLIYEDMTLPPAQRFQQRLQRRVSAEKETPAGRRISITYTTFTANQTFDFVSKDGGWAMLQGDTPVFTLLPEGFPDRVDRWEDPTRGWSFEVIGRGALQNSSLDLPDDFDRVGVWVEMRSRGGTRQRIFYLPGIGEAESRVLKGGQWVLDHQLVSRGFTDAPPAPKETAKP